MPTYLAVYGLFIGLVLSPVRGQGIWEATLTIGNREEKLRYVRSDKTVRFENPVLPEKGAAPPVNLLNTETGAVTVFMRHNSTYLDIPAEKLQKQQISAGGRPAGFAMPPPPSGMGPDIGRPQRPGPREVPRSVPPDMLEGIGPSLKPGLRPSERPLPPEEMKGRVERGRVPVMPAMPGIGRSGLPRLEKTEETEMIRNVVCHKYSAKDPMAGELVVWAIDAPFRFYLPMTEAPRPRGRMDLRLHWPSLLRDQGLFPMRVILRREESEVEMLRFEMTRAEPGAPAPEKLTFKVPDGYFKLDPSPF